MTTITDAISDVARYCPHKTGKDGFAPSALLVRKDDEGYYVMIGNERLPVRGVMPSHINRGIDFSNFILVENDHERHLTPVAPKINDWRSSLLLIVQCEGQILGDPIVHGGYVLLRAERELLVYLQKKECSISIDTENGVVGFRMTNGQIQQ